MRHSNTFGRPIDLEKIRIATRGQWFSILLSCGFSCESLNGKHGPCPFCQGKDRWRWDNRDESGSGICSQCGSRDGIGLVQKKLGLRFVEALKKISDLLDSGFLYASRETSGASRLKSERAMQMARAIWNSSQPLDSSGAKLVAQYFSNRSLSTPVQTQALRFNPALKYFKEKPVRSFPGLVGAVTNLKNEVMGIHRTLLSSDGRKADVAAAKMLLGSTRGYSIKLDTAYDELHVAEGIETALAVREVAHAPTWVALSAGNMSVLELPKGLRVLEIWADFDPSGAGERAAKALGFRAKERGVRVFLHVPRQYSKDGGAVDWLDVLALEKRGAK